MYLSNKDYNKIYSSVPRVCVDLIIRQDNGIILTKRNQNQSYYGKWHVPGGRIRFRESISKAITRIAKSELNATVQAFTFWGVIEFMKEVENQSKRHSISLVYEVLLKNKSGNSGFESIPNNTISGHKEFLKKHYGLKISKRRR